MATIKVKSVLLVTILANYATIRTFAFHVNQAYYMRSNAFKAVLIQLFIMLLRIHAHHARITA